MKFIERELESACVTYGPTITINEHSEKSPFRQRASGAVLLWRYIHSNIRYGNDVRRHVTAITDPFVGTYATV